MAKYKYTAIDAGGKQVSGRIDAATEEHARAKLTGQRFMVTSLIPEAGTAATKAKSAGAKSFSFGGGVGKETITLFTRQLATLLQAGLPLLRALEILNKQEKNPALQKALAGICEQVQSGTNLSDALQQYPKLFDRLYINMIKAGEAGGVLDTVLDRLARFAEKALKVQKKVKSAMVYPAVVVTVAIVIVYVLMVYVVPSFQKMLENQKGAQMPWLTEQVVKISKILTEQWYTPIIAIVVLYFGGKAILSSKAGKKAVDKIVFRIPKVGTFVTIVAVSRFARTFGTLMASGVPILQAITITRDTMSNVVLAEALTKVHDRVRDGESLSVPLEQSKIFPSMVTSMIQVGEETGQLPEMLNRVADNYDEEIDNNVSSLTSIIEPLLIVFLAVVVGTIVIAMFLPLIELIRNMTGG